MSTHKPLHETTDLPADLGHLPDDPMLLKRMLTEVLEQLRQSRRHNDQLQARLEQLLRRLYGPRAERIHPDQRLLFAEDLLPAEVTPLAAPAPEPSATPQTRRGHGRQTLPKHLPRERRVYELSTVERACACCGQQRSVIGAEISEQLDYVPASLTVIEHVRLTYACTHCQAPRQPQPAILPESPAPQAAYVEPTTAATTDLVIGASETAVPQTKVAESTIPQLSTAEATAPQTTTAEATAPQTTTAEATAPQTTTAEATAPQTTTAEATAPQTTTAATTTLQTTTCETTTPQTTAYETTVPQASRHEAVPTPRPSSTFSTAPKPLPPWPRSLATPGLLAHIIVSKFGDHLPLHRLQVIFARSGVSLTRSTMCDWLAASATLLRPLFLVMVEEVFDSWVIQTDDTPMPVLDSSRNHTRQGRLWTHVGDSYHPYIVYDYTPNREQEGPQRFLKGYCGYLQADAYPGYNAMYDSKRLSEVACWAHVRRKFYEARTTDPVRGLYALGVIKQLYAIERQAREQCEAHKLSLSEFWWLRLRLRNEQAVPILHTFCAWLKKEQDLVLPKSPIGEAIRYALNLGTALGRYTTQGYLEMDNTAAERALRALALGRKNYMFFGSDGGGATAAVLYSFVQTCKRLAIEPWRYLRDVLTQLPNCPTEQLPQLLPDRWAETQAAQARAAPAAP